jgi:hypothetical protein
MARLVILTIVATVIFTLLRYLLIFQSAPWIYVLVDVVFFISMSLPLAVIFWFAIAIRPEGRYRFAFVTTFFLSSLFLFTVAVLISASNVGLSQRVLGFDLFVGGKPTTVGMVELIMSNIVLAFLDSAVLQRCARSIVATVNPSSEW